MYLLGEQFWSYRPRWNLEAFAGHLDPFDITNTTRNLIISFRLDFWLKDNRRNLFIGYLVEILLYLIWIFDVRGNRMWGLERIFLHHCEYVVYN